VPNALSLETFSPAELARLAAAEGAPTDDDADWLMDRVAASLTTHGGEVPEAEVPVLNRAIYALSRVGPWRRRAAVEWLAEQAVGPFRRRWGATVVATALTHRVDAACAARLLQLAEDERVGWGSRVALAQAVGVAGLPLLAQLLPGTRWVAVGLLRDVQASLLTLVGAPAPSDAPDPLALLEAVYADIGWLQRVLLLERVGPVAHAPERVAALLVRLGQRAEPATRRAVAAALGRVADPAARRWLVAAQADADEGVRRAAEAALAALPAHADDPEVELDQELTAAPLPVELAWWARLAACPRALPLGFWPERLVRSGGAYTVLAWLLLAVSGLGSLAVPHSPLAASGLVVAGLWLLVAVPVGLTIARAEAALLRHGFATLGQVTAVHRRVTRRRVRGSTIRTTWHDHHVRCLSDQGDLTEAVVRLDRPLVLKAGEPEALLQAPGERTRLLLFRADGNLRVDAAGQLRFGWGVRSTAALLLWLVAMGSVVGLAVRTLAA